METKGIRSYSERVNGNDNDEEDRKSNRHVCGGTIGLYSSKTRCCQ